MLAERVELGKVQVGQGIVGGKLCLVVAEVGCN